VPHWRNADRRTAGASPFGIAVPISKLGSLGTFEIRRASLADVDRIAAAHRDSIRSIGPRYYEPETVNDWGRHVEGTLYVRAMTRGEVFYVAIGQLKDKAEVLGFSSHAFDGAAHRTAVYVRGQVARLGIGSALFRTAEAAAIAAGADSIHVDASLAAVQFYKANGFEEIGSGEHRLPSGRSMPCMFMRKKLP
jgi:putative acetyltransferase